MGIKTNRWLLSCSLGIVLLLITACSGEGGGKGANKKKAGAVPVQVGPVRVETIELRRTFSGSLEAPSQFTVAPKVGGRLVRLAVDLADPVRKGQVVAELDDEEFQQAVNAAEAELVVAEANQVEARGDLEIASREMKRIEKLVHTGFATEAQLDSARAKLLSSEADTQVAAAQVTRARATLSAARVRLGYTRVSTEWSGEGQRYVSQRHIREGSMVSANTPLLTVVALDPMIAVVYVTEKDYGLLKTGQQVALRTDAHPGTTFPGSVARVAPAFNRDSRQARVEIAIANPEHKLKPGMFVQAEILLDQVANATTVPLASLVDRNEQAGVFVVDETSNTVSWRSVTIGIRQGERVQVEGEVDGMVVTLGQQLIQEGSAVILPTQKTREEQGSE